MSEFQTLFTTNCCLQIKSMATIGSQSSKLSTLMLIRKDAYASQICRFFGCTCTYIQYKLKIKNQN